MLSLEKAATLDTVYTTLVNEPLMSSAELAAFYVSDLNQIRGSDRVELLSLRLNRSFEKTPFKCLLMSHPGAGKSTEMTRLAERVENRFETIRISVLDELDPQRYQPFDILILITMKIAEATKERTGLTPPEKAQQQFLEWFAKETKQFRETTDIAGKAEAGAGLKGDSLWGALLGLFANLRGEIKYTTHRERKREDYRLSRLSQLIELANEVLAGCNRLLRETKGREWLLIGEDFEKEGVNPKTTESFFIDYRNVIQELNCHYIFTIPIALGYSSKAEFLPVKPVQMTDIPVFDRHRNPYDPGRQALANVLKARMDEALFDDGQMERLVIASGGNLRDLFTMVTNAADDALIRGFQSIGKREVDRAISDMRVTYERRLGQNPFDTEPVTYDQKKERLKAIYMSEPKADVPDPVLYALLRARAVQEFNGEQWFGLHPLVVDIMIEHGVIPANPDHGARGGTR